MKGGKKKIKKHNNKRERKEAKIDASQEKKSKIYMNK
jgi:hypothetical protein